MKRFAIFAPIVALVGCASVDVVRIDATGATTLYGKPIRLAEISDGLKRDTVVIRADRSARQSDVMAVMQEAKEAGVENVTLATEESR